MRRPGAVALFVDSDQLPNDHPAAVKAHPAGIHQLASAARDVRDDDCGAAGKSNPAEPDLFAHRKYGFFVIWLSIYCKL